MPSVQVPPEILSLLENGRVKDINTETENFWILCRALKNFISQEGQNCLPLAGQLPDMKADTQRYIQLQTM